MKELIDNKNHAERGEPTEQNIDGKPDNHNSVSPSKMCIDVVAETWGKQHGMPASTYIDQQRFLLNENDHLDLNLAWEALIKESFKQGPPKRTDADTDSWFLEFRQLKHCE